MLGRERDDEIAVGIGCAVPRHDQAALRHGVREGSNDALDISGIILDWSEHRLNFVPGGASSTGPSGCLSAGICERRAAQPYAPIRFSPPTLYLPRRKSNAGRMECEKCGLAVCEWVMNSVFRWAVRSRVQPWRLARRHRGMTGRMIRDGAAGP